MSKLKATQRLPAYLGILALEILEVLQSDLKIIAHIAGSDFFAVQVLQHQTSEKGTRAGKRNDRGGAKPSDSSFSF